MEKFCAIIPNRPGREKLYDFCIHQISKMTLKPDMIYNIDYPAVDDNVDICERVYDGMQRAKADGFDVCFIIENDDRYPPDYFQRFGSMYGYDFFGSPETIYYNINNRSWSRINHNLRSSLFTTGFRIKALEKFIFPKKTPFLDLEIWKHAKPYSKRMINNTGAIGIKGHGIGLCGGKGHVMNLDKKDPYLNWLRSNMDNESFEFYVSLI